VDRSYDIALRYTKKDNHIFLIIIIFIEIEFEIQ
jgi:hypothetical protein